ncbi:DUF3043 domain-containing protein [Hoyosella rhizosphaerae]|uniref:DUF3043 domain-containing protein n=1 Tax=Hoyosella rhizosphaerae TaxID=1755582 RepID=A0A916UFQ9_9ACTN|nr:DUF3043 domain-containing protein [Hoyosella rhizosphaerae]MBN4927965.1 DUF3043 domain-containing protein [Hoyosella rhizosphaerae]GGC71317.1 hypothetical protein GCM10011410_25340 [Hoyosella rhizosphaerae]
MKSSGRGSDNNSPDDGADSPDAGAAVRRGYTPAKGRATPKRSEKQRGSRGPIMPPPMTRAEARARRKAIKAEKKKTESKMTKAERKKLSAETRMRANERRQRMMSGEEEFLLPRDRGQVRRFARNYVDARRNLAGLFMPLALVVLLTLFMPPEIQGVITLGMLVFLIFMIAEGIMLGRTISNKIRERFPDSEDTGFSIGWYSFVRATQVRRLRVPRPQVRPGDPV